MSNRKPYRDCAGYVASRKNPLTGKHNVIYVASEQGLDTGDKKYVTICEAHLEMIAATSVAKARVDMKDAMHWCSGCQHLSVSWHG